MVRSSDRRPQWTQKINLTVSQLKHYLSDRNVVNANALKKDLVARCCPACLLNLQPKATPVEYNKEIANQKLSKLILDGVHNLPI